ncbi:MAG: hypothetical protein ACOVQ0_16450 [Novosphingobium sp.]|uniref:hypothetical protein n=1 Tax=Novosphingobium sp. TaxID=1874826 RepID=UPI003B9D048B
MSKALKVEKPTPIAQLAQEAFEKAGGDMPTAADELAALVMNDRKLSAEIMPVAMRAWAAEMVRTYAANMRVKAIASLSQDMTQRGGRLRVALAATLFDFPLPGGKRLGDANGSEIRDGAGAYKEQAADMNHKARWLEAVADRVGTANRADAALTLPELEALFEEAKNA